MGKILNLKTINDEKVNVTLELSAKEYEFLRGSLDKMFLFSENNLKYETRLVQRGKKESTKYFLMPREFRKNTIPSNNVKCNMIDTKTRQIFILSLNKF